MHSVREIRLITKLKEDDIKAFDSLFNSYSKRLYGFAFSLLKNSEDSEGIIQEVFLRIWDNRKKIDATKSFKSYLFKISYNLIIDRLRKRLNEKEHLEHLSRYFDQITHPSGHKTDYDLIKSQVDRAVEELPEKRKQIYILSREQNLTHKEIAEKLNISVKTVENQINLALKHIKHRLGTDLLRVVLFLILFA